MGKLETIIQITKLILALIIILLLWNIAVSVGNEQELEMIEEINWCKVNEQTNRIKLLERELLDCRGLIDKIDLWYEKN